MKTGYFTICSTNYLAYAQTLYQSLLSADPQAAEQFTLFLADEITDPALLEALPFRVIESHQLDIPTFWDMAMRYSIMEFNTAIKPSCFQYLFEQDKYDAAIYLDPDIFVVRPLQHVTDLLDQGASLVLTPHITQPLDSAGDPNDLRIMRTGCYNLGFLGAKNTPETKKLMFWWADHLVEDCRVDLAAGIFVDQKFMDLAPSLCPGTEILHHNGYNTAYWNLAHRPVEKRASGWYAGDDLLHFFHFSGVVPGNPSVFSKHQDRFSPANIGDLNDLLKTYLDWLQTFDHSGLSAIAYAYRNFTDDTPIPDVYRAMFARHKKASERTREAAFSPDFDWALEPEDALGTPFRKFPISRLLYQIWLQRPDLQKEFGLYSEQGREALLRWFFSSAPIEYKLPADLVGKQSARVKSDFQNADKVARASGSGLKTSSARFILGHVSKLRGIYRLFPQDIRSKIRSRLFRAASSTGTGELSALKLQTRGDIDSSLELGVSQYGYFRTVSGVGEGARQMADALALLPVNSAAHNLSAPDANTNILTPHLSLSHAPSTYRVALFHANADQTEPVLGNLPADQLRGQYRIGYWAWELAKFPQAWVHTIASYDEIWVPSTFIRDALREVTNIPVEVVPHCVSSDYEADANEFPGLESGRFHFVCAADLNSYAMRKNLQGSYDAFCQAFPAGADDDPRLVIKLHGADDDNPERLALHRKIANDPRVICIDAPLDNADYRNLQNTCDAFISLHRSEGFGMNISESMARGKIVIATGYSGNTDYADASNTLVVPYKLVPIGADEYPHGEGQVWAEPDIAAASKLMREAAAGGQAIETLQANALNMRKTHSTAAIAKIVSGHLDRINVLFEASSDGS